MNKPEKAVSSFKDGFSCSQVLLSTFAEENGLDVRTAQKLASAFGGGIARNGEMCGAVTGALMAIGLKHWKPELNIDEAKMHVYNMSNRFMKEFKAKHNSVNCRELLGCDLSTDEGRKKAKAENVAENICEKLVHDASAILEKIL